MMTRRLDISLAGLRRKARLLVFLTLLTVTPTLMSCYGHFPLTRLIYRVNGEVGGDVGTDKSQHGVVQSIVMWVFIIVPVYCVSSIVDVLVLNLIEFWSGEPVVLGEHVAPDGTRIATIPSADGRTAAVTITSKDGKTVQHETLVKVSDKLLEVRNEDGLLAGTAERNTAGDMIFKDAHGKIVSTVPAAQAQATAGL